MQLAVPAVCYRSWWGLAAQGSSARPTARSLTQRVRHSVASAVEDVIRA